MIICVAFWGERVVSNHQEKGYGVEKSKRQKKNPFWIRKMPTFVHRRVPYNIYLEPLQRVTVQKHSFRWQSISQFARPCILSPTPITYLRLALALRLFLKPAQLPGLGRTLISVSSPRTGSSLLSQQKRFREGSEKCQSWQENAAERGRRKKRSPLFISSSELLYYLCFSWSCSFSLSLAKY